MWDTFADALVIISANHSPSATSSTLHQQRLSKWPRKGLQVQDLNTVIQPKMPHSCPSQDQHTLHKASPPGTDGLSGIMPVKTSDLASRRMVRYRAEEMMSQCIQHSLFGCGRCQIYTPASNLHLAIIKPRLTLPEVYQHWFQVVAPYSVRRCVE